MKDRVPGAPGQYQAVITAEEQQKLSAAEPFIITLTRDDHPVTEGTPYSKAAVLPDNLAESLCREVEDPTPADAFAALHAKAIESRRYPGSYYRVVNGRTEWINPPMVLGDEYCTTQRYNGKPVYVNTFNLGVMPSGSASSPGYKWTDIGVDAHKVLGWDATVKKVAENSMAEVLYGFPYGGITKEKFTGNLYFQDTFAVLCSTERWEDTDNVNLCVRYVKEVVV